MTTDRYLEIEGLRKAFDDFAFAARYGIIDGNPRVDEGVARIEARMDRLEALLMGEAGLSAVFVEAGRGAQAVRPQMLVVR